MMARARRHPGMAVGLLVLAALLVCAATAPLLSPYSPTGQALREGLRGPSAAHLFGQDRLGRDVLTRVLYGARVSLWVGTLVVGISVAIGLAVGGLAGSLGGMADDLLMRISDILQAFPGILLAIAFAAVLGPSLLNVVLALCLIGWVGYARLVRGQILVVREMDFVHAAGALGAGRWRIAARHLLPNILAPVIVEASFGMAGAIVGEASLSFLGLGTQPPTASWGSMLNEARNYLLVAPHLVVFPGLAVMAVVLGLNFLGDGLRDLLDPRR
ncbi:MAG TPA: ABC transporter permease [Candidatus Methylomirabilis sp.]|jgi:peptide/nickel transport system permease protein